MKLPIHPQAPCRIGDKRYTIEMVEVPTRADIMLGLVSSDHTTWPRIKYSAYGTSKVDATRRAEGYA